MAIKTSKILFLVLIVWINAKFSWKSFILIPLMSFRILQNHSKDYVQLPSINNIPSYFNWVRFLSANLINSTSLLFQASRVNAQESNKPFPWAYQQPITTIVKKRIPIFTSKNCPASITSLFFVLPWFNCNPPLSIILYSLSSYCGIFANMIPHIDWWEVSIEFITISLIFLKNCKVKISSPTSTR